MRLRSRFSGTLFWVILGLTAFFGSIFLLTPALPLILVKRSWYRKVADEMLGLWLTLVVAVVELVYEVKVKVTGDVIERDDCAVIVMNHRTRLDWLFFWTCLWRHGYTNLKHEKIILKHELKMIPGAGWAMQCGAYIFLRRKWQEDEVILGNLLGYFKNLGNPIKLLIFPEGTDLNPKSLVRSQEYAASNCLRQFEYVLHPRTTGLKCVVEQLCQGGFAGKVYDVTVAYPSNIPQGEADIARGEFPEQIVYAVAAYHINDVLSDPEGSVQAWCQKRWEEKESRLREFYSAPPTLPGAGCIGNPLLSPLERVDCADSAWLVVALIFWLVFVILCATILIISAFARYYAFTACLFFIACSKLFDGFEFVQSYLLNCCRSCL